MAEPGTRADSIRVYLTGAFEDGGLQEAPDWSLGITAPAWNCGRCAIALQTHCLRFGWILLRGETERVS